VVAAYRETSRGHAWRNDDMAAASATATSAARSGEAGIAAAAALALVAGHRHGACVMAAS